MAKYAFSVLQLPCGGMLGLGCCPGHRLKQMSVVPQKDSLSDDLARIVAWRPHMVLTLMEDRELTRAGISSEALLKAFARDSILWRHLPIENLEAPGEEFEAVWPSLWPDLDRELRQGSRLFLHCYAGLGRTGMIASLILTNYGLSARDAMCAVRAARPGAIESLSQERFLRTRRDERKE